MCVNGKSDICETIPGIEGGKHEGEYWLGCTEVEYI
jgi:hypothetical protein